MSKPIKSVSLHDQLVFETLSPRKEGAVLFVESCIVRHQVRSRYRQRLFDRKSYKVETFSTLFLLDK
jgi:hypothetical protein